MPHSAATFTVIKAMTECQTAQAETISTSLSRHFPHPPLTEASYGRVMYATCRTPPNWGGLWSCPPSLSTLLSSYSRRSPPVETSPQLLSAAFHSCRCMIHLRCIFSSKLPFSLPSLLYIVVNLILPGFTKYSLVQWDRRSFKCVDVCSAINANTDWSSTYSLRPWSNYGTWRDAPVLRNVIAPIWACDSKKSVQLNIHCVLLIMPQYFSLHIDYY